MQNVFSVDNWGVHKVLKTLYRVQQSTVKYPYDKSLRTADEMLSP